MFTLTKFEKQLRTVFGMFIFILICVRFLRRVLSATFCVFILRAYVICVSLNILAKYIFRLFSW